MPEPKQWIKEWLSNRQSQFQNNYNEHRTYTNNYLTDTNKGFQARNKKLDAEGSTARRSKLYGEEYFIPEYKPRYLTDMLSNLDTVKEYTPTSYSDPGGEVIKTAYYNNIVPQRKAAGTLFTPEQEQKLHDRRQELVAKYRAGELSKNQMRDTFSKEWNATIEKNINTPFYQAKEQTGWQGQYFPTSHEIVYTRPTLSNRVHELSHSLYLYPKKEVSRI